MLPIHLEAVWYLAMYRKLWDASLIQTLFTLENPTSENDEWDLE